MKKRTTSISAFMASMGLLALTAACTNVEQKKVVSQDIIFCESTYPYKDGMLIANFGGEALNPLNKDGKGYILNYKDGKTTTLIAADGNLSAPKGMCEKDGYLYICDVNKLVIYNLNALDQSPQIIIFPADDLFLNDLAVASNTLYISVTNSGRIYQLDISNPKKLKEAELGVWLEVTGPNGILVDGNSMYIASYPADGTTTEKNIIYKVENLAEPVASPFYDVPGQYDGIALADDKATLYISNWTPAEVTAIDMNSKQATKLSIDDQLVGPADMTLKNGKLYIPDLPNSRMLIHQLGE